MNVVVFYGGRIFRRVVGHSPLTRGGLYISVHFSVVRKYHIEYRTVSTAFISIYLSIVVHNYFFTHGQANARPFKFGFPMKSLKDVKYLGRKLFLEAYAVVRNPEFIVYNTFTVSSSS